MLYNLVDNYDQDNYGSIIVVFIFHPNASVTYSCITTHKLPDNMNYILDAEQNNCSSLIS